MGLSEEEWKHTPNETTVEAMKEAGRIIDDATVKGFTSLDELFAALKS